MTSATGRMQCQVKQFKSRCFGRSLRLRLFICTEINDVERREPKWPESDSRNWKIKEKFILTQLTNWYKLFYNFSSTADQNKRKTCFVSFIHSERTSFWLRNETNSKSISSFLIHSRVDWPDSILTEQKRRLTDEIDNVNWTIDERTSLRSATNSVRRTTNKVIRRKCVKFIS